LSCVPWAVPSKPPDFSLLRRLGRSCIPAQVELSLFFLPIRIARTAPFVFPCLNQSCPPQLESRPLWFVWPECFVFPPFPNKLLVIRHKRYRGSRQVPHFCFPFVAPPERFFSSLSSTRRATNLFLLLNAFSLFILMLTSFPPATQLTRSFSVLVSPCLRFFFMNGGKHRGSSFAGSFPALPIRRDQTQSILICPGSSC